MATTPPKPIDLSLPRILCLHGGGVTAEVFQLQARSLIKALPTFRLVFADGPFFCAPGPGIASVYEDYGPFRRWLRWLPEHPDIDDESAIEEVMYAIETCKSSDPGTGPWVGLMGFSQGAKLAASLLYDQQVRVEKTGHADTDYKFAVLLAGRQPLMQLSEYSVGPATLGAGEISEGFNYDGPNEHILRLPTIHVHGLNDAGLHLHRDLLRKYCHPDSVTLIEWDGAHRVPLKKTDVDRICTEIYRIAKEQGVSRTQLCTRSFSVHCSLHLPLDACNSLRRGGHAGHQIQHVTQDARVNCVFRRRVMKEGVPQTSCSCRGVPRTSRILERDCQNRAKGKDALDIRSEREVTHKVLRPHAPEILLGIVLLFPGGLEACPGRAFVHLLHGLKGVSGYIAAHGMCSVAVAVEQSVRLLRTQEGFENALTGEGDELLKRPRRYRPACRRVLDTAHDDWLHDKSAKLLAFCSQSFERSLDVRLVTLCISLSARECKDVVQTGEGANRAEFFLHACRRFNNPLAILHLDKREVEPMATARVHGADGVAVITALETEDQDLIVRRPAIALTGCLERHLNANLHSSASVRFRERYRRFVCSTGEHDVAVTTSGMCSVDYPLSGQSRKSWMPDAGIGSLRQQLQARQPLVMVLKVVSSHRIHGHEVVSMVGRDLLARSQKAPEIARHQQFQQLLQHPFR
ncbi:PLP-dependent transferase, partial [Aureobasidium melanogenum]